MSRRLLSDIRTLTAALAGLALVVATYRVWLHVSNPTTASLTFLLIVLLVAAASRLWVAIVVSLVAMFCFNFFFLPPVGTLTVADPQNWVALFAFLAVSVVASNLSAAARSRAAEARERRNELTRLFDLSRDVLVMTDEQALAGLARSVANRFGLDYVAIALPEGREWKVFEAGPRQLTLDRAGLSDALSRAGGTLEFDARARTYGGHAEQVVDGETIRIVPLRMGTKVTGLLAAAGPSIDSGSLDALAGIVAIAIERARFLDERKTAELTRQSEQLKSALLASLGHDLRTPLTAIRVAASNLQGGWLSEDQRRDQSDVILTEVERLTRLFQNILSMARIEAGPVETTREWVVPSEIIVAAREQVEQTLRRHRVNVHVASDEPVRLDPRLTATALAHVLENAAQYSPAGRAIDVTTGTMEGELRITVKDSGAGISAADLPRLFERFFRGEASHSRTSGTGMGLSIARGLLAAQGGRIWAENDAGGGAVFTIAVPIAEKGPETVKAQ